jgi:isopentenyl diphosphate isomerase/L-lactate dehydrogenase-like FMN-dependent dehydrogenase
MNLSLRREFLRFLAASPALLAQNTGAPNSPKELINVMDFEPLAKKALPLAHWGYLATGVDDELTLRLNHEAYSHYQTRARRLIDVSKVDLKTELFGMPMDLPIYASAVGGQGAFHTEAEVATAKGAKAQRANMMLSTVSSASVENVAKALGSAPWYQLYMPSNWPDTEKMVKRAEDAGCPALVWTIDLLAGRNTETATRTARQDTRDCLACHVVHPVTGPVVTRNQSRPMFAGLSGQMNPNQATWEYVDRLKKMTRMKLMLKGIDTAEDAKLAQQHGVDGLIVSNHGGRAAETGRATIDILPEVIDAVGPQLPVLVDGGIRRGSDVYKALALGARAVGIGRPYIWGLSTFGEEGVARVFEILRAELTLTMRQLGTPSIAQINRSSILRNGQRL